MHVLIVAIFFLGTVCWAQTASQSLAPESNLQGAFDALRASDATELTLSNYLHLGEGDIVHVGGRYYEIVQSSLHFWDAFGRRGSSLRKVKMVRDLKTGEIQLLKRTIPFETLIMKRLNHPNLIKAEVLLEGKSYSIVVMPFVGDPSQIGKEDPFAFHNAMRSLDLHGQRDAWLKILDVVKYLHQEMHITFYDRFDRHIRFTVEGEPILFDFSNAISVSRAESAFDDLQGLGNLLHDFYKDVYPTPWGDWSPYERALVHSMTPPGRSRDSSKAIDFFIEDVKIYFQRIMGGGKKELAQKSVYDSEHRQADKPPRDPAREGFDLEDSERNLLRDRAFDELSHYTDSSEYRAWLMSLYRDILPPKSNILSLGAGMGVQEGALIDEGYSVLAVESFQPFVDIMEYDGIPYLQGDAREILDFLEEKFDVVLISEALGSLGLDIVGKARRVLRPNGMIVIVEYPYDEANIRMLKEQGIAVARFKEQDIFESFSQSGFQQSEVRTSPLLDHDPPYLKGEWSFRMKMYLGYLYPTHGPGYYDEPTNREKEPGHSDPRLAIVREDIRSHGEEAFDRIDMDASPQRKLLELFRHKTTGIQAFRKHGLLGENPVLQELQRLALPNCCPTLSGGVGHWWELDLRPYGYITLHEYLVQHRFNESQIEVIREYILAHLYSFSQHKLDHGHPHPENILIHPVTGALKLIDFGRVRKLDTVEKAFNSNASGFIIQYLPPMVADDLPSLNAQWQEHSPNLTEMQRLFMQELNSEISGAGTAVTTSL